MSQRGILIVISGFSGAGKGTVMKSLLQKYPTQYALSISATSREPRTGERNGIEYFFKTREEFKEMIANDQLIEYAEYVGNYYGTPKEYVTTQLENGKNVILEIEIQGCQNVKKLYPDAVTMFITPPSAQELYNRLVGRGTETMDVIQARLARAAEEAEGVEIYDYLVINDELEECVETVHQIIQSEHRRLSCNIDTIHKLREELKGFSEGE